GFHLPRRHFPPARKGRVENGSAVTGIAYQQIAAAGEDEPGEAALARPSDCLRHLFFALHLDPEACRTADVERGLGRKVQILQDPHPSSIAVRPTRPSPPVTPAKSPAAGLAFELGRI